MAFAERRSNLAAGRHYGAGGRFSRFSALLLVLLLAAPSLSPAWGVPPEIPYGGYNIDGDPWVAKRLYPDALKEYFDRKVVGVTLHTPTLDRMAAGGGAEKLASDAQGEAARFTSNEEVAEFIRSLPTTYMRIHSLGKIESKSEEGETEAVFPLLLTTFSKPPVSNIRSLQTLGKPVVWLQAQVHGDEPAGTDAMLALARDLAADKGGLLGKISVAIIPRVNVDGAWRNRRGTDSAGSDFENLDVNRDALSALSPITRAVRSAFAACRPHVFVDFHEMGYTAAGSKEFLNSDLFAKRRYYDDCDLATLVAHPYNVPRTITALARELELSVARGAEAAGLKTGRYAYDIPLSGGGAEEGAEGNGLLPWGSSLRMMEGPPDECILDSATALSPSVSMLVETRAPKILVNFKTRVYAHYIAGRSVLRYAALRSQVFKNTLLYGMGEIQSMGRKGRLAPDVVLWARQAEERGALFPTLVFDASKKSLSTRILKLGELRVNRTLTPVKSVKRPYAYVLSADAANAPHLAARLALTGVTLNRLAERASLRVEAYTVKSVAKTGSPSLSYEVRSGDYFPVSRTLLYAIDEVGASVKTLAFPKGAYFFYMAQPSANLAALAVEPMGNRNLGNYWYSLSRKGKGDTPGFLPFEVGGEFPVYRVMSGEDFSSAVPMW